MSSKEEQELSFLICSALDNLGFKEEMISFRAKWFDEIPKTCKRSLLSLFPLEVLSVGSSGEGFRHRESDVDIMVVFENTVCVDTDSVNTGMNVLAPDYTNTAPGYTKVVLINKCSNSIFHPFHFDNMFKHKSPQGYPYVSSKSLVDFFSGAEMTTITGPAVTCLAGVLPYPSSDLDIVLSFHFLGKDHLRKWVSRVRYHSWPSNDVIGDVFSMKGYIVAIGDKQSDSQSLEWRICYTLAEKKLVSNLKNVHKKLYILLKIVAKRTLKPVCKAITSYVVKNVVFWIAEGTPTQQCSEKFLLNLLQKSLFFIKHCLKNNHLPNFMIPKRNLLRGSVCCQTKEATIGVISELLKEGGAIITKIPNLHRCILCIQSQPDVVLRYGKWRDEVERQTTIFLILMHRNTQFTPELTFQNIPVMRSIFVAFFKITNVKKAFRYLSLVIPEFLDMLLRRQFSQLYDLYLARLQGAMLI